MYTKKERDQYNHDREIVCKDLMITINQYNWFRRKGAELHRIYEDNCNGFYETEDEYYSKTLPVELSIEKKAEGLSLEVYHQTDPRGASLYLGREAMSPSNYNSKGHAIV